MEFFEPKQKFSLRKFFREHSSGIFGTIIFHLVIFIVLIGSNIYSIATKGSSILIDFSGEEKRKAEEKLEKKREEAKTIAIQQLNAAIASNGQPVRNVAVDVSEINNNNTPLKDDRGTNADKLYDEARQVQEKIDASRAAQAKLQGADEVKTPAAKTAPTVKQEPYKGASVISYDLAGRKGTSLKVPAYQCQGGGDIKVLIEVNPQGYVVSVSIDASASTDNTCLHEAAKRFALSSRFSVKKDAPAKQKGNIVYRFIAQ